LTNF
jgi:hypothetical protein